jgi:hypothetical protein
LVLGAALGVLLLNLYWRRGGEAAGTEIAVVPVCAIPGAILGAITGLMGGLLLRRRHFLLLLLILFLVVTFSLLFLACSFGNWRGR